MKFIKLLLITLIMSSCYWTTGPYYTDNSHNRDNDKHLYSVDTFNITYKDGHNDSVKIECEYGAWKDDTLIVPMSRKVIITPIVDSLEIINVTFPEDSRNVLIRISSDSYNYRFWAADTVGIYKFDIILVKRVYRYGRLFL